MKTGFIMRLEIILQFLFIKCVIVFGIYPHPLVSSLFDTAKSIQDVHHKHNFPFRPSFTASDATRYFNKFAAQYFGGERLHHHRGFYPRYSSPRRHFTPNAWHQLPKGIDINTGANIHRCNTFPRCLSNGKAAFRPGSDFPLTVWQPVFRRIHNPTDTNDFHGIKDDAISKPLDKMDRHLPDKAKSFIPKVIHNEFHAGKDIEMKPLKPLENLNTVPSSRLLEMITSPDKNLDQKYPEVLNILNKLPLTDGDQLTPTSDGTRRSIPANDERLDFPPADSRDHFISPSEMINGSPLGIPSIPVVTTFDGKKTADANSNANLIPPASVPTVTHISPDRLNKFAPVENEPVSNRAQLQHREGILGKAPQQMITPVSFQQQSKVGHLNNGQRGNKMVEDFSALNSDVSIMMNPPGIPLNFIKDVFQSDMKGTVDVQRPTKTIGNTEITLRKGTNLPENQNPVLNQGVQAPPLLFDLPTNIAPTFNQSVTKTKNNFEIPSESVMSSASIDTNFLSDTTFLSPVEENATNVIISDEINANSIKKHPDTLAITSPGVQMTVLNTFKGLSPQVSMDSVLISDRKGNKPDANNLETNSKFLKLDQQPGVSMTGIDNISNGISPVPTVGIKVSAKLPTVTDQNNIVSSDLSHIPSNAGDGFQDFSSHISNLDLQSNVLTTEIRDTFNELSPPLRDQTIELSNQAGNAPAVTDQNNHQGAGVLVDSPNIPFDAGDGFLDFAPHISNQASRPDVPSTGIDIDSEASQSPSVGANVISSRHANRQVGDHHIKDQNSFNSNNGFSDITPRITSMVQQSGTPVMGIDIVFDKSNPSPGMETTMINGEPRKIPADTSGNNIVNVVVNNPSRSVMNNDDLRELVQADRLSEMIPQESQLGIDTSVGAQTTDTMPAGDIIVVQKVSNDLPARTDRRKLDTLGIVGANILDSGASTGEALTIPTVVLESSNSSETGQVRLNETVSSINEVAPPDNIIHPLFLGHPINLNVPRAHIPEIFRNTALTKSGDKSGHIYSSDSLDASTNAVIAKLLNNGHSDQLTGLETGTGVNAKSNENTTEDHTVSPVETVTEPLSNGLSQLSVTGEVVIVDNKHPSEPGKDSLHFMDLLSGALVRIDLGSVRLFDQRDMHMSNDSVHAQSDIKQIKEHELSTGESHGSVSVDMAHSDHSHDSVDSGTHDLHNHLTLPSTEPLRSNHQISDTAMPTESHLDTIIPSETMLRLKQLISNFVPARTESNQNELHAHDLGSTVQGGIIASNGTEPSPAQTAVNTASVGASQQIAGVANQHEAALRDELQFIDNAMTIDETIPTDAIKKIVNSTPASSVKNLKITSGESTRATI